MEQSKKASCFPLSVTYKRTPQNINKHNLTTLALVKYRFNIKGNISTNPVLASRRNRNLQGIIGGNKIEFNKVKLKSLTVAPGKCTPGYQTTEHSAETNN